MAVGDDSVKTDLVQVRSLELEHLVNAAAVDLVGSITDLLRGTIRTTETGIDELGRVLLKELEGLEMSTCGDLDQLCEAVPDLRLGQSSEETEIEERVDGCVVSSQAVLVVAIIDGDLDGDGGIDETNDGGGDADEVGVPTVGGAGKTTLTELVRLPYELKRLMAWVRVPVDVIFGRRS